MTQSRIDIWIEAGYKLLAKEGLEGLKIERLARVLNLNKSGFYYYFGTLDSFVKQLIEHHVGMAKAIAEEIAICDDIDPDLLLLVIKHKIFFLAESQLLVKNRQVDLDADEAGKIINDGVRSLWAKITGEPNDPRVSSALLSMIRHFLYARIDERNLTYEFIHQLSVETKEVFAQINLGRDISSPDNKAESSSR
ncbi:TetR/AcrR family transcriptional regulator [Algoriphagus terrigena]|uniref:TetR/AcrR family transcriptional regulator n=1 Tax=Algoriphagus terrigena TaxID=344884 RepID=UPI000478A59F|nr:TetR/AcrR family transcriptional regulator [Algoriphagus terrigena]